MSNTAAWGQLFSTSSGEFHSYGGGGGGASYGAGVAMRSTSSYTTGTTMSSYSTAPMRVANGGIQTVANQLDEIRLADDLIAGSESGDSGFIPTNSQRASIAPPTIAPLGLDWDAFLLLLSLAALYAFRIYRKLRTAKQ